MDRFLTFLQESKIELKKVTWPTREETIQSTVAVIIISGIVAAFLGGLDFIFRTLINRFIL
mgnify:CR=1 FL=1